MSLYYFVYTYLELLYLSDELILDHLGNVLFVVMCLALKFFLSGTIATALPGSSVGKESACNAGDIDSMPRSGRSPGEGNGNPLQYSYLGNPMDVIKESATT